MSGIMILTGKEHPSLSHDSDASIWNSEQFCRNRVFSTYWYVLVLTWYIQVQERYNSTSRYVPVCTEYVPE
jgi:hypothetical protein